MTTTATTDERALEELQREHGTALHSFLLNLTYGDRQRAEDLVQETLVRAWLHPEAFHGPYESMRPWLFTVARRLAIDARRSRLARPTEIGDDPLMERARRVTRSARTKLKPRWNPQAPVRYERWPRSSSRMLIAGSSSATVMTIVPARFGRDGEAPKTASVSSSEIVGFAYCSFAQRRPPGSANARPQA